MKTVEERACEFVDKLPLSLPLTCVEYRKEIEIIFIDELKRQDKITRRECIDAINEVEIITEIDDVPCIFRNDAFLAVHNSKAI